MEIVILFVNCIILLNDSEKGFFVIGNILGII